MMLSREFFESEDYFLERFSRREAFLDLCYLAAYKDRTFKIRGVEVHQKAGQVAKSLRDLAQRWKWSVNTVVKYLNELKAEGKIDTQQTSVIQLITIKRYLIVNTQTDTQFDTQNDTQIDTPIIKYNKEDIYIEGKPSAEQEGSAVKKKRKPIYKTLGGKCREKFEEYYTNKVGEEYQYTAADGSNMKKLLDKIRSARESRNMPIDDDNMISAFVAFLNSINSDWILSNLSVKVINSKYNEIVSSAKAGKKFGIYDINHSADDNDPHKYDGWEEKWYGKSKN